MNYPALFAQTIARVAALPTRLTPERAVNQLKKDEIFIMTVGTYSIVRLAYDEHEAMLARADLNGAEALASMHKMLKLQKTLEDQRTNFDDSPAKLEFDAVFLACGLDPAKKIDELLEEMRFATVEEVNASVERIMPRMRGGGQLREYL